MMRAVVALVLVGLAVALSAGRVEAFVGDVCHHARDCGEHEVCVADGEHSSTGHCQRITVLP
jgi:hypothetical protein